MSVIRSCRKLDELGYLVDVGCSRGDRLARLARRLGLNGVGLDLSLEAIAGGRVHFGGDIELLVRPAHATGLDNAAAGVCFFGWVLTYANENYLAKILEECLRVLAPNGMLAVFDWDYGEYLESPYKHYEGLSTYRHDYQGLFERAGMRLVDKASLLVDEESQRTYPGLADGPLNRTSLWVFCRDPFD